MATQSCAPPKQEYDFSMFPFPGNVKVFPAFEIGIKVTLGVIVELVAIIGNILVITIVVRFKRMRTTTNFYLVNLAVSDILVVLIPVWVLVVDSLTEFWVFGSFLCKFNPFLQSEYSDVCDMKKGSGPIWIRICSSRFSEFSCVISLLLF